MSHISRAESPRATAGRRHLVSLVTAALALITATAVAPASASASASAGAAAVAKPLKLVGGAGDGYGGRPR